MYNEIKSLEENKTWEVVDLSDGNKPIGCKWVYKVKLHPDGSIGRYKVGLVVKGYSQVAGVDYFYSFSPIAKTVIMRVFFTIVSSNNVLWSTWISIMFFFMDS